MIDRRGFLQTLLGTIGGLATAHPLGDLVAGELVAHIPKSAKLIQPAGDSFFVQQIAFFNREHVQQVPRLLIGSWELDTGLLLHDFGMMTFNLGPTGGYQLDPGERLALMGRNVTVALHGFRIPHRELVEPGETRLIGNPFEPYTYWLRV